MRLLSCIFFLLVIFHSECISYDELEETFSSYFIVPYILKVAPPKLLSVRYATEEVLLGNTLSPYVASTPPLIYYEADPDSLYTLLFLDIDYPSILAPVNASYLHALIVNIQGNDLTNCNYVTPYIPVTPGPGSGYHRYVFLVYKQEARININTPYFRNLPNDLDNFCLSKFVSQYSLGTVYAGNFFLSQLIVCDKDDIYDESYSKNRNVKIHK